jgi:hypothetical protein
MKERVRWDYDPNWKRKGFERRWREGGSINYYEEETDPNKEQCG